MDHYSLLGVSPDASLDEITHAYHERLQLIHPDRSRDPRDNHRRTVSTAELIAVIATLRDPLKRADYDRILQGQPAPRAASIRPRQAKPPTAASECGGPAWATPPQPAPRPQGFRRPSATPLVALGLGLVLLAAVATGSVPVIVGFLLVPVLLPPFRATTPGAAWRIRSAVWLLLFEASLPGVIGANFLLTRRADPQYAVVGSAGVGLALLLLVGAALIWLRRRGGIAIGAVAAVAGLTLMAAIFYVLPAVLGTVIAGPEFAAWVLVPVVALGMLASLVWSPVPGDAARS